MFSHSSPTPLRHRSLALLVAAALSGLAPGAFAGPTSPQVVAGQASFAQQGNVFSITSTPNTIINWASFSVNQGEVARFIQQSASSAVLNRITGQDPTRILGALQSNGKVFLINPNGVLFGAGAQVDVNGLVASSLNISNADFLAHKLNFSGTAGAGAVSNQGAITTPSGGQVFLIAPNVSNSGIIQSPQGEVILAAGHSVQLADSGNPDLHVVVSAPADQALNLGQVIAQGGRIGIYGALINQRGTVSADSAVLGANGKIVFKSSGTTTLAAGSRSSANGVTGGSVEVLGASVSLEGDARIDASGANGGGTVLLGGGVHGADATVPNAQTVYVSPDAVIAADAASSGKGGTVAVWSDQSTRMFGSISARGGASGGDGGFVETSGHYLAVDGARIDTRARGPGATGQWLLDPYDIDVVGSGGSLSLADASSGAAGPQSGVSSINAALISGATSNVTLQASDNITFSSAVNIAASGVGLNAQAGNGITVSAPITTHGGALTLQAGGSAGLTTSAALSAGSGAVSLTADSMSLGAAVSGNSVTLAPFSSSQRIALGEAGSAGTLGLLQSDLNHLNTGVLTIAGNNGGGDFAVSSAVSFPNTIQYLTMSTHGAMQINAALGMQASGATLYADVFDDSRAFTVASGASVSARTISVQASTMNLAGAVSGSGSVSLTPYLSNDSVDIGGAGGAGVLGLSQASLANVNTPSLSIVGYSGINVSAPVTLNQSSATLISATALTVADGASLSGRSVALRSDLINLAGTLNASVGANIVPFTSGKGITLGGGGSGTLALGATDLNHIVTPLLQLGNTQGGAIGVNGAVDLGDNVQNLNLFSAGAVSLLAPLTLEHAGAALTVYGASFSQGNGGGLTVPVLNVSTSGALDLTQAANQIGTVTASSSSIALGSSGDLAVGAAGLTLSGTDAQGNIAVDANGLLALNGSVQAGTGNVALTGGSVAAGVGAASQIAIGGAGVTLTANAPGSGSIHLGNAGIQAADVLLQADQMTFGATSAVTAGGVALRPFSNDRAIAVGTPCTDDDACLGIASLNNIVAGSVAIGSDNSGAITVGNIGSGAGTLNAATNTLALLSGRSVTQADGSSIAVRDLAASAVGSLSLDQANQVQNIAATLRSDGAALVVAGAGALKVAHLSDTALGYDIAGISDAYGEIVLSAGGAVTQGIGAPIVAHALTVSATNGIGTPAAPLLTQVAVLNASNVRAGGAAPISIRNNSDAPGMLTLTGALQDGPGRSNGGAISIENTGAFEVPADATVSTSSGNISLVAHSPLTIAGTVISSSGNIALEAGATGSAADVLTIASGAQVTTAHGNIALKAGGAIDIDAAAQVAAPHGTVTQSPSQNAATPPTGPTGPTQPNGPTLNECIANPALAGCAAVLPPISACVANPSTAGCTVVLPTILACIANPTAPGCTVVLPPLSTCTVSPSTQGCSVVLPPLSVCTVTPSTPGCAAVLPSLSTCTVTPSIQGCSAVLPSLSACTASPATPGCSAVLPSLAACSVNAGIAGCSAVLPSLSQCTASPGLQGCGVVLPSLSQCVANPAAAGCPAVLPTLAQCVANPAAPGCSVILPTLSQCVANPLAAGCSAVLPTLAQCAATPSLPGCATVTPPSNPSTPVIPPTGASQDQCALTPSLALCQVLTPPTQSTPAKPVTTAQNAVVALIPNAPGGNATQPADGGGGSTNNNSGSASVAASPNNGASSNDTVKKMYCN